MIIIRHNKHLQIDAVAKRYYRLMRRFSQRRHMENMCVTLIILFIFSFSVKITFPKLYFYIYLKLLYIKIQYFKSMFYKIFLSLLYICPKVCLSIDIKLFLRLNLNTCIWFNLKHYCFFDCLRFNAQLSLYYLVIKYELCAYFTKQFFLPPFCPSVQLLFIIKRKVENCKIVLQIAF